MPGRSRCFARVAAALTAFCVGCLSATVHARPPDAAVLVERLHAYLEIYEPQLSALVADEAFDQVLRSGRGPRTSRHLLSDFGFLRLPGGDAWLGQRSVRAIDGVAVIDEPRRLESRLAQTAAPDLEGLARAIADDNARHNLGHARSMNVPTLALELVGRRHAELFTLVSGRAERVSGRPATRLFLRERHPGRLVAYDATRANRADVLLWVDETGAVLRSEVTLYPPRMPGAHVIRVEFAAHPTLGLWLPARLEERFNGKARGSGTATYTNYRRFQTSARLVPPSDAPQGRQ